CFSFLFNATSTSFFYTLSLHDALPIYVRFDCVQLGPRILPEIRRYFASYITAKPVEIEFANPVLQHVGHVAPQFRVCIIQCRDRSEEHTSELQSPCNLVCRLLLEKKKK